MTASVSTMTVSIYCALFAKIDQSYFQNGERSRPRDLVPLTPPPAVLCCVARACVPTVTVSVCCALFAKIVTTKPLPASSHTSRMVRALCSSLRQRYVMSQTVTAVRYVPDCD